MAPQESNSVIQAVGLVKNFPGVKAVDGLSLEVERGEVLCIIGPNGAGKTTLLYLLAGLVYPSAGHARVFGLHRWKDSYAIRLRSAVLPAVPVTGASPTPYEYLRYVAQVYAMPKARFLERLERLSREMNYTPYLKVPWAQLSLGLRKKAGLISCFLPEVELRILDEPFAGGIDPLGMEVLYRWFGESRARGETVVFSTQVLDQAQEAADRIVLVRDGRVAAQGTPEEILRQAGIDPGERRALARAFMALASTHDPLGEGEPDAND